MRPARLVSYAFLYTTEEFQQIKQKKAKKMVTVSKWLICSLLSANPDRYSDTSNDWTLVSLNFTEENYRVKLI